MPCRRLLQRRGPSICRRSGRSPRPDAPLHRAHRPPTAHKKKQGHRKARFSSLFASQTTRAPTRSRLRSEVRSLYSRRCWPCGALGWRQLTQATPRAIASYPRCRQNESAAGRCAPGRTRAVARLVGCQRLILDLVRFSNLEHSLLDRTQSRLFLEFLVRKIFNGIPR